MSKNIRLDGRCLISTYDLMIPIGASCEVDIVISQDYTAKEIVLPLSIAHESGSGGQSVSFIQSNGRSIMTLINWSNPLGTALNAPYELAVIKDEGFVDLLMCNYTVGNINHLTMQLWWRKLK
ncbi:hypothetical protein FBY05_101597 [Pseudomonas sp. SJZ083]|nr:hypothetical protein FBY05_101597 [Pseudomonas sp. SJZ083]TWC53928.1 hypothetical protein FBY01_101119 [Pseudomonas sp. SJZ077]